MTPNWVWVVEMQFDRRGEWRPTISHALTRAEGRKRRDFWNATNRNDAFRLRQYVRKETR